MKPRRTRYARMVAKWVIILLVIMSIWWLLLYLMQDRMIFPRDLIPFEPTGAVPRGVEAWQLPIHDNAGAETGESVDVWFQPARGTSSDNARSAVVLYFHGNAELIDFQDRVLGRYRDMGVAVALLEYRGYGKSGGKPTQAGITADAIALYDKLIEREDIDPHRVVFHGRSLGGAVAADLSRHRPPAGMILESSFTSVADVARRYAAPPLLIRHPFRTADVLRTSDYPVLLFHGSRDTIISSRHSRRLHEITPNSTLVEYPVGHNDFPGTYENDFWDEVSAFLARLGTEVPSSTEP